MLWKGFNALHRGFQHSKFPKVAVTVVPYSTPRTAFITAVRPHDPAVDIVPADSFQNFFQLVPRCGGAYLGKDLYPPPGIAVKQIAGTNPKPPALPGTESEDSGVLQIPPDDTFHGNIFREYRAAGSKFPER